MKRLWILSWLNKHLLVHVLMWNVWLPTKYIWYGRYPADSHEIKYNFIILMYTNSKTACSNFSKCSLWVFLTVQLIWKLPKYHLRVGMRALVIRTYLKSKKGLQTMRTMSCSTFCSTQPWLMNINYCQAKHLSNALFIIRI